MHMTVCALLSIYDNPTLETLKLAKLTFGLQAFELSSHPTLNGLLVLL